MEMDNYILGTVSDDDDEASLLFLYPISYERRNARVSVPRVSNCVVESEILRLCC